MQTTHSVRSRLEWESACEPDFVDQNVASSVSWTRASTFPRWRAVSIGARHASRSWPDWPASTGASTSQSRARFARSSGGSFRGDRAAHLTEPSPSDSSGAQRRPPHRRARQLQARTMTLPPVPRLCGRCRQTFPGDTGGDGRIRFPSGGCADPVDSPSLARTARGPVDQDGRFGLRVSAGPRRAAPDAPASTLAFPARTARVLLHRVAHRVDRPLVLLDFPDRIVSTQA